MATGPQRTDGMQVDAENTQDLTTPPPPQRHASPARDQRIDNHDHAGAEQQMKRQAGQTQGAAADWFHDSTPDLSEHRRASLNPRTVRARRDDGITATRAGN